ncbi:MAG TPA: glycosyltransferase family 2 protein [Opitutaceae bacterium]|nr:glycosyltransferase family 2 protein [Opitutaceae bacterium]
MHPTFSLVTPSFNQAPFLAATLDSVLGQNYPQLDYVVVDGGSTDGSRDLIVSRSSRLGWWCSEPDSGLYAALNKGFARTTGEIMGWLNSDDLHFPWTLRTVGEIFARFPEIDWLSSLAPSTWSPEGHSLGVTSIEGFSRTAFLDGGYLPGGTHHYGWIPQESTFWRRSLWEKAGSRLDASLRLAGDFELWARFYQHAELTGTPSPLAGFRTHAGQKSRAMDSYLTEARGVLEKAQAGHFSSPLRKTFQRTHLSTMPGLRGLTARLAGYPAKKIHATADGGWRLETYRFL